MRNDFQLSEHARTQISERKIQATWIEATLSAPDTVLPMADSHGNTHYLKRISDFGNRWLRVVVNPNVNPKRVVTLFFDRRVK